MLGLHSKDNQNEVLIKNKELILLGLSIDTFGNASAKNRDFMLIKPSGVDLNLCSKNEISVVDINSGKLQSGKKPSSDTPTHLELYRNYNNIGGITHTHSLYATAWAQAAKPIPCLGTTHADYWKGEIPVTRELTSDEINGKYELETGKVIVRTLQELKVDPLECPGIIVAHHGPFTWGKTIEEAVKNAVRLEYIARMACMTLNINPQTVDISPELHHRHFSRKHGPSAYYGQENS
jgi:L-ribulose-5-phosphate 4-epimerase